MNSKEKAILIKIVATILLLPGHIWFTYDLIRIVITDVYNRCAGTGWCYVFWSVVAASLIGYILLLFSALLCKDPISHRCGIDIDAC